jgi:hypothetical protein
MRWKGSDAGIGGGAGRGMALDGGWAADDGAWPAEDEGAEKDGFEKVEAARVGVVVLDVDRRGVEDARRLANWRESDILVVWVKRDYQNYLFSLEMTQACGRDALACDLVCIFCSGDDDHGCEIYQTQPKNRW